MDSESESNDAIAVVGGAVGVCRCVGRCVIGDAVPCETITFRCGGIGRMTVVDSQVEGYHTVTAMDSLIGMLWSTR